MKKKFAFLLMGSHYNPEVHQACFETEKQIGYVTHKPEQDQLFSDFFSSFG
ncbi:hypothetical protein [Lacrimispora brassicae]